MINIKKDSGGDFRIAKSVLVTHSPMLAAKFAHGLADADVPLKFDFSDGAVKIVLTSLVIPNGAYLKFNFSTMNNDLIDAILLLDYLCATDIIKQIRVYRTYAHCDTVENM